MPHLSWNEIRDRAIRFSRDPSHTGARSERSEKQTFWNDFFEVFGLRRASLASFEENVRNLRGHTSAIDLLWKGKLLVEHKSRGEDLSLAATQAFAYIEDLTRENRWDELPRFVLVSDFGRFALYDLEPEDQLDLPLFQGRLVEPHHFTLAEFSKNVRHFAFTLGQSVRNFFATSLLRSVICAVIPGRKNSSTATCAGASGYKTLVLPNLGRYQKR